MSANRVSEHSHRALSLVYPPAVGMAEKTDRPQRWSRRASVVLTSSTWTTAAGMTEKYRMRNYRGSG